MKYFFGFTGKIGSGKFYQMSKMVEHYKTTGHSVYMTSYADPLKDLLRSLGITKEGWLGDVNNTPTKDWNSVHETLQKPLIQLLETHPVRMIAIVTEELKKWLKVAYIPYDSDEVAIAVAKYADFLCAQMQRLHVDYDDAFRRIIQTVGTEIGRAIDTNLWVKIAISRCKIALRDTADVAFIDDVRFFNEYQAIIDAGGQVYGVVASDETRARRRNQTVEQMREFDKHGSESSIEDIIRCLDEEYLIHND